MKISQLIDYLKTLDPNMPVMMNGEVDYSGVEEYENIRITELQAVESGDNVYSFNEEEFLNPDEIKTIDILVIHRD